MRVSGIEPQIGNLGGEIWNSHAYVLSKGDKAKRRAGVRSGGCRWQSGEQNGGVSRSHVWSCPAQGFPADPRTEAGQLDHSPRTAFYPCDLPFIPSPLRSALFSRTAPAPSSLPPPRPCPCPCFFPTDSTSGKSGRATPTSKND